MPPQDRAELLEARAYELYVTDRAVEAITAREEAIALREQAGDRAAVGAGHRWVSRLAWFAGRRPAAERHAALAVELLEGAGDRRELGFAYSNRAQLAMLAGDHSAAVRWGLRALELAGETSDAELRAHALNNVGTARVAAGDVEGRELQRQSIALARREGLDEHVARGYTNVAWDEVERRRFSESESTLREGLAFSIQRDLDAWRRYMLGCRARQHLLRGRWTAAVDDAESVLSEPASAVSRVWPLMVVGVVATRRGDPAAGDMLDEAWALATRIGEVQRLAPVAAARAEHAWTTRTQPPLGDLHEVLRKVAALRDGWAQAEVAAWLRRLGDELPPLGELPEPYSLELAGDFVLASASWREVGCPFEAALALADADSEATLLEALDELTELGAEGSAGRVRRRLRDLGVTGVPRGPRPATRANPAQLTARQVEVLGLVAAGRTNAEIAEELVISPKTAGHHVSAILNKLGARSRMEAANAARELGVAG